MAEENKKPSVPLVITKNMPITIHASMIVLIVVGTWALSSRVASWESRFKGLERHTKSRWSYEMEEDAWREFERTGKTPDLEKIKGRYFFIFED